MGSNPAAPTSKPFDYQEQFVEGGGAGSGKNGTERRQSAQRRAENPEKVPNGVHAPFPAIIAEWDRNRREVIRVALDQYNGHHTINVRVWYRHDGGELRPTKSGLTLGFKHLPRLARALAEAADQALSLGLMEREQ